MEYAHFRNSEFRILVKVSEMAIDNKRIISGDTNKHWRVK